MSTVDIINHGKQTQKIGGVAFIPGVIRLEKSKWQGVKSNASVQTFLDDGQFEVRKDMHGVNREGSSSEYGNIGYKNFAQERLKPKTPSGSLDSEWLQDQVELMQSMGDPEVNNKQGAVNKLAELLGVSNQKVKRKL